MGFSDDLKRIGEAGTKHLGHNPKTLDQRRAIINIAAPSSHGIMRQSEQDQALDQGYNPLDYFSGN